MHLLLARHGETEWNVARRIQGWGDSALTERGLKQAQSLAERLKDVKLTAAYSSTLPRAMRTADIATTGHGLSVTHLDGLRENGWGAWEGKTATEIEAESPELWAEFVKRGHDEGSGDVSDWESTTLIPGGETLNVGAARVMDALDHIRAEHPGENDWVLVVGHGGSLRFAFTQVLELRPWMIRRFHLDNASLSHVHYMTKRAPVLSFINDTGHVQR
jgi:probable phosphoglycerate mutase